LSKEKQEKLMSLKLKINEAKKLTNKEVIHEEKSQNDPNYQKTRKWEKIQEKQKLKEKELQFKGIKSE
jgi:hypothetical protein